MTGHISWLYQAEFCSFFSHEYTWYAFPYSFKQGHSTSLISPPIRLSRLLDWSLQLSCRRWKKMQKLLNNRTKPTMHVPLSVLSRLHPGWNQAPLPHKPTMLYPSILNPSGRLINLLSWMEHIPVSALTQISLSASSSPNWRSHPSPAELGRRKTPAG